MLGIRLSRALAEAGAGFRREIDRAIQDGRVTLNGKRAVVGQRLTRENNVAYIDGKRYNFSANHHVDTDVLALHKPPGTVVSSHDEHGIPSVYHCLPPCRDGRWIYLGRLDIATSGLLLFTNDGRLARDLMHPSSQVEREYVVRYRGHASETRLRRLVEGIYIDGKLARFEHLVSHETETRHGWCTVVVTEGRNRIVRHLFDAIDHPVSRLKRVRFGPVFLEPDLRVGRYRRLTNGEMTRLQAAAQRQSDAQP